MSNARKTAATVLTHIERDGGYSNIVLDRTLRENDFSDADRAFLTMLVYGTLDRKITLDYYLNAYVKQGIRKVQPFTRNVLRTALYQLLYMERIPQSAAVNEAVKLVKTSKERYNAAFVNAVLRRFLREPVTLPDGDDIASLSVRFSCPEWIVSGFAADYGNHTAEQILRSALETPPVYLQVNTLRTTPAELIEKLAEEKIKAVQVSDENTLRVIGGIDVKNSTCYQNGLFYIEDMACQRSIAALSPKMNDRVLDLCAAPGGKSFAAALLMQGKGVIHSYDLYEKRVRLIRDGAERLGLEMIRTGTADATVFDPELGKYDCVICDVPCSGLGVLRRKPEIRYKEPDSLDELAEIQRNILENAARYTKLGGRLLYSTCTLRHAENEDQIKCFLDGHPEFVCLSEYTFLPHIDGTDGFYRAVLEKGKS